MLIRDLTLQECQEMMIRTGFGRLGCAIDNQPYVVPIYFAYQPDHLYSFTTVGRKIEWMRKNPKVCVEVDEVVGHFRWMSVIVTGRYQELPNTPELSSERLQALKALDKNLFCGRPPLRPENCQQGIRLLKLCFIAFISTR
jgi:nitroimidazol reductase NimA-like FMN-containing flavoprotein (pyridoxamine 5'-phosphate oxidase superfamily)